MRRTAQVKARQRELRQRREHVAGEHREVADEREHEAERAEQQARVAQAEAERQRAEAQLHQQQADLHERGMADDDLVADHERERFAPALDEERGGEQDGRFQRETEADRPAAKNPRQQ
jgi:hypothetical protein